MIRILLVVAMAAGACGGRAPAPAAAKKEFAMKTYYMGLLRRGPAWAAERTPETIAISDVEVVPWYGPVGLTYDGAEPPTPGASCTE